MLVVASSPSIDVTYVVDRLQPGSIHRPSSTYRHAGGKGLNVARSATSLGADVTAVGIVGGYPGQWIAESLTHEGVKFVPVMGAKDTRSCVSIADAAAGTLTEVYEPATPVSKAEWDQLVQAVLALVRKNGPGWLTISGGLPAGAPDDALPVLVSTASAGGAFVAVDTHGPALAQALRSNADLIKVNAAEASAALARTGSTDSAHLTAGSPRDLKDTDMSDPAALCHALRSRCPHPGTAIVVTAGTRGAAGLFTDDPVRRVEAGSLGKFPVGSGDAFLAGLVVALDDGADPGSAMIAASAAAAANAAVPGAGRLGPYRWPAAP